MPDAVVTIRGSGLYLCLTGKSVRVVIDADALWIEDRNGPLDLPIHRIDAIRQSRSFPWRNLQVSAYGNEFPIAGLSGRAATLLIDSVYSRAAARAAAQADAVVDLGKRATALFDGKRHVSRAAGGALRSEIADLLETVHGRIARGALSAAAAAAIGRLEQLSDEDAFETERERANGRFAAARAREAERAAIRRTEEASRRAAEEARRREAEAARRREAEEAALRKRRQALEAQLDERFRDGFLSADGFFERHADKAFVGEDAYRERKAAFVRQWAQSELGEPLDAEQAAAVAATAGNVLVEARAGSGKTRILVTRAIFLVRHCGVSPREMLLLAFNRDAANEMKKRLRSALGKDAALPHVMTFHALAYAIVHPDEKIVFDDKAADNLLRSKEFRAVIDGFVSKREHEGGLIRQLMLGYFRGDEDDGQDGPPEGDLADLRVLPREALGGERLKSRGERIIANALFEHGVAYHYERSRRWNGVNYRPDFTILKPRRVVIEYFGMAGDPDYDEMSDRKRAFWSTQPEWAFLEYGPRDIAEQGADAFSERLRGDLDRLGVRPRRLSEDEIWARVRKRAVGQFSEAMATFAGLCRKRNLTPDGLERMISMHVPLDSAERLFLQAALPIYRGYLERLDGSGKEDFDGLMWRAIELVVRDGVTRFVRDGGKEQGDLRRLRFVMIDEFQDFSRMFCGLADAIRAVNPGALFFAAGDDWQAINGFAGSDLEFFAEFDRYFGPGTRRIGVRTNYRSADAVVETGNALMRGLGEGARAGPAGGGASAKGVRVGDLAAFDPSVFEEEDHEWDAITPAVLRLVRWFLSAGQDVVLLSRTNYVPWEVARKPKGGGQARVLKDFLDHVRGFLPRGDRKRVTASTAHSYKGQEQQAVVVLDVLKRRYPLIHPHWIFTRIFGDGPGRIEAENRRLLYVAITRARASLVLLTEAGRESPWIEDIRDSWHPQPLRWAKLPSAPAGDRVEVRVRNAGVIGKTKDLLMDGGYRWYGKGGYWRQPFPEEAFSWDELLAQPWVVPGVTIEMWSGGELLRRYPDAPGGGGDADVDPPAPPAAPRASASPGAGRGQRGGRQRPASPRRADGSLRVGRTAHPSLPRALDSFSAARWVASAVERSGDEVLWLKDFWDAALAADGQNANSVTAFGVDRAKMISLLHRLHGAPPPRIKSDRTTGRKRKGAPGYALTDQAADRLRKWRMTSAGRRVR